MRETTLGDLTVRITGGTDREGGGHGPVVVLMHGFGAPTTDLLPLHRVIDAPPGTRFVFPAAPLDLGAEYAGGHAWWHIDMIGLQLAAARGKVRDRALEIPPGLAEARALVLGMLEAIDRELAPSHLVLGGFSQGAMLACDVALHTDRALDALVMLSGTFIAEPEWGPRLARRKGLPVLMSHGDADPILPIAASERLRDRMTSAGLDVRWVPFYGGHEIPPPAIDALGRLLREKLVSHT